MVLIKFLSLLLLLPSLIVTKKLIKKQDLNFFDLLILFNTLYFVLIPLKSSQEVFNTLGIISQSTSLFVFFYLLFFFICLLIGSNLIKSKNRSPINITYCLKKFPYLQVGIPFKLFLVALPIFSLIYYIPQMSVISAFEVVSQSGKNISYEQSSMIKFFSTVFRLGLIITLILFFQDLTKKKIDKFILVSLSLFLVNLLMLSRRQLLVFLLFTALIFYSNNRELINRKVLIYITGFCTFLYFVYFPFYNIIRHSPIIFTANSPITSIKSIYDYGIRSFEDNNKSASQSVDTRALGLYRSLYKLAEIDSDTDITWGAITLSAIDHAIPKVINPGKGSGSELLLQNRLHTNKDSADSILLIALADYSILGSIITALIFFVVYKILYSLYFISESIFGNNHTKWVWWLLPLNILILLFLIKSKIG